MKAMVLAAGLGVRMRPLTQDRPKPVLRVLGRPMIVQILRGLARASVDTAVINLHYHPEVLRELLGDGGNDGLPEVRYTFEDPVLGTGGGLRHAADLLRGDGPFVVHNSDFLSDVDLGALLETHERGGYLATLALTSHRTGYSVVEIDNAGHVLSLGGSPAVDAGRVAASLLFTGCHVLDESLLERLPSQGPSSIIDLYRQLALDGRLGAYLHDGFWWEFGTPQPFLEGQLRLLDLEDGERSRICSYDPIRELAGCSRVAVGAGAELDENVELSGRCALGLATRIGSGSRLTDTIVLEESWVGPDCHLERVIVGPHSEVPAGFRAKNAVICPDLTAAAEADTGIEIRDGLLVRPFGV